MEKSTIRFTHFPLTEPTPKFILDIVAAFKGHERALSSQSLAKGLISNKVLEVLSSDLRDLGFDVESADKRSKIQRPVFFGENGEPALLYHVDAYHKIWKCGLEIEAARAWMGNAIYRDIVQAMVMVEVDFLVLAVSNRYRYKTNGRPVSSPDYENTISVASALYGHNRLRMPYKLSVIGY